MSKRKNLLNERTVRRFMKLANVEPLAEGFFDSDELTEEEEEEVGSEPDLGDLGDLEGEEGGEEEVPELGDEELGLEGGVDEDSVRGLVDAIADAISDETGIEVNVDGAGGEEAPPEEGEPELDLEEPSPEEGGEEAPEALPEEGGEEVPGGRDVYEEEVDDDEEEVDDDLAAANVQVDEDSDKMNAFVNEISRRVARRLLRSAAKRNNS